MKLEKFLKVTVATGLPFGILWGGFMRLAMGPSFGLGVALAAGTLFGLMMAGFQAWMSDSKRRSKQMPFESRAGETVVHEGPANHKLGLEYRGGWLFLTNERLAFRPHAMNIQKDTLDLERADLAKIDLVATLGVVPNGLLVTTRDGKEQRFVVVERSEWAKALNVVARA